MKTNPMVYWCLIGDKKTASSRIHGYNIHKKLKELGYNSRLLITPYKKIDFLPVFKKNYKLLKSIVKPLDVIVIQKYKEENSIKFIQFLKSLKCTVVFLNCDQPLGLNVAKISDKVICTSNFLLKEYVAHNIYNCNYIPDCPELFKQKTINQTNKKTLKLGWFGIFTEESWKGVEWVKSILKKQDQWELVTISNSPHADYKWNSNSLKKIWKFDAIVIPVKKINSWSKSKSSNRLLQSLALGLPVMASKIPAYEEILINNTNGVLFENEEELLATLNDLTNENLRKEMAKKAYSTALKYSLNNIINQWIEVLNIEKRTLNNYNLNLWRIWWFRINIRINIFLHELYRKNNQKTKSHIKPR
jgi:glycosyltransferase involved in cell wall biosynthesis